MKSLHRLILPLAGIALLAGCQSYTNQSANLANSWQSGNSLMAASEATQKAEAAAGTKDELLWRFEQGTVLNTAGSIAESNEAFDKAEEIVNRYEDEAKVKVGSRTASYLTNQAALPYTGRAYEKIMMNSFKALNYLLLADTENARIELNRALQRQRDAVDENQRRIEEAAEQAEASRKGELEDENGKKTPQYDVDRAMEDPKVGPAVDAEIAALDARLLGYADYVNPFTVFLDGLFFSYLGLDNADIERARKSFERVASMSPGNHIMADYAMTERMARGEPAEPTTYVVFSTGSAPIREELRIDIPLFLVTGKLSYTGAALPRLQFQDRYVPYVDASTTDGTSVRSEMLSSMDAVIARDFKNTWPSVLTNTLIATAVKGTLASAAEQAVGDDWRARLLAKAVSIGTQAALNKADLRAWRTLPKEFSYVRMATPGDGQLNLRIGQFVNSVEVVPGKTNIILVRSINDVAPPAIHQFTLEHQLSL